MVLTNLCTKKIGKKLWRVINPMRYGTKKGLMTVPKGFVTDGASAPGIAWSICPPMGGAHAEGAVLHDWLYSLDSNGINDVTRKEADDIFYDIMRANGTSWVRAQAIHKAVRAGGWSSFKKCYSKDKVTKSLAFTKK